VAQLQAVTLGYACLFFQIKIEQKLSLGVEKECVEGGGGEPDVGSVVALPRFGCETRLFPTFRFHIGSYRIVRRHFQGGVLAFLEDFILDRGEVGQTGPEMLLLRWGTGPKACGCDSG
jgi:hypothetical protein